MRKYIIVTITILCIGCNVKTPKSFSEKALKDTLIALDNSKITFKEVISQYQGKKILIDVWASWCTDCISNLPKIKELQKEFPEIVFLFLSVDKNNTSWKKAITKFTIKGEHYNLPKGMKKGDLVDFLSVGWIPRYLIINEKRNISLFKATKISDVRIKKMLSDKI